MDTKTMTQEVTEAATAIKKGLLALYVATDKGFATGDVEALSAVHSALTFIFGAGSKGTLVRANFDDQVRANTNKKLAEIVLVRGSATKESTESKYASFLL